METLVRAVGAVAALMIALGFVMQAKSGTKKGVTPIPPHGLTMPGLAIEFVKTEAEVDRILHGPADNRYDLSPGLLTGLRYDYLFIALYWLLFLGLSFILARRGPGWPVWVAALAALCATGAAVSDVFENVRIAALLNAPAVERGLVESVRQAGLAKWWFFALTTLLLSPVFLRGGWLLALGALFVAAALICIFGLVGDNPLYVERSFKLSFVCVAVLALVLLVWPRSVLERGRQEMHGAGPGATGRP